MKELRVDATIENIETVIEFVNKQLEKLHCSPRIRHQIDVAVDELFSNIALYAYPRSQKGTVTIQIAVIEAPCSVSICFIDNGVPFNPFAKKEPNVMLSLEERPIGGLGIYIVKKSMDSVSYEYKNGQNIVQIQKKI